MNHSLYDITNSNFIHFWKKNKDEITARVYSENVRCLSYILQTNLGIHEAKKCKLEEHRYILNLYDHEKRCYSICIDNYSEGIILEPTEILSTNGYDALFNEVAQRILADSEAIKDCKLQDLEQYRI